MIFRLRRLYETASSMCHCEVSLLPVAIPRYNAANLRHTSKEQEISYNVSYHAVEKVSNADKFLLQLSSFWSMVWIVL